jgi:hypothetical protein
MQSGTHTQSRRIGRRNYMRAMVGGATAVGAGSVGVTLSGDARAIVPAVGVGAALATGAAAGYLMREAQNLLVEDVDSSKYADLAADSLHTEIRSDAIAMKASDDTVLTTFENLLSNAQNAAFANAKYAAVESMNLGDSETVVTNTAVTEIDNYYATQQTNLAKHLSQQSIKLGTFKTAIDNNSNLSQTDVFSGTTADGSTTADFVGITFNQRSVTLVDGSSVTVEFGDFESSPTDTTVITNLYTGNNRKNILNVKPVDTGSTEEFLPVSRYDNVWQDIINQHSTVKSEIETWISSVYPEYSSGDIALSDLVNPSDIASKAPDEQGYSYAGADLALLGIEGAEHRYKIDLKQDEKIVTGTVYAQGRTDPLDIGTVYSPGDISGTVWLAYETGDGEGGTVSDLIGLEQDFEILSGIDQNGEEVSEVTFRETNQQTTDTDIQTIKEELQQLQDLQNKLEEQQRQEVTSGGGGGGGGILPDGQLIDGISNKILGAGAAAVAIYGAISS